jgi:peptidoglycan/xylan/chitin deacetylase (PgdA/CDA1 family)
VGVEQFVSASAESAVVRALGVRPRPYISTRRLEIAEHLGLPCAPGEPQAGEDSPAWADWIGEKGGRRILWPRRPELSSAQRLVTISLADGVEITVCARVLSDARARELLDGEPGEWTAVVSVTDTEGHRAGSIWRDRLGNVVLPFDPDEVLTTLWSERYTAHVGHNGRGLASRLMLRAYYRVRGLMPRALQIWVRRQYARLQARTPFPRWPVEPCLHDFLELFMVMLADACGRAVPYLSPWPDDYAWAMVLTHDVETAAGLRAIEPVLAAERRFGLRSAWNFVPRRYEVSEELVSSLKAAGCEVGVHGLYHDGRDLSSLVRLRQRLPAMHAAAQKWGAIGFRSPASHRRWEWMPLLGFDYDSSYPDTDPFEPQRGGCCSWWPFFNGDLVELPLSMPHDHTLFRILGHRDETMWVHKAEVLRRRGGMALLVTHPDYLIDACALRAYEGLLERYAPDPTVWRPLPAELSAWWRQRAASKIVSDSAGWSVSGPAAMRARIAFVEPRSWF